MSRINYDTDIVKHYVRYNGWLKAFTDRSKSVRAARNGGRRTLPLKYFTFCASSAIDVFMLEKAKLLKRDKESGRLENVFFCEKDEEEFATISNLIGSAEAGFMEAFEDFVLFKDDKHTKGKADYDPTKAVPDEASVRRKFACKKIHIRFLECFPFDVINLDLYGNLFPPDGDVFSRMFETIEKVFEWQNRPCPIDDLKCEGFTLFLTIYVHKDDIKKEVCDEFITTALDNLTHDPLRAAFNAKYPHGDPDQLMKENFPVFFSIILPKIVANLAKQHGWFGKHRHIYLYSRRNDRKDYHMMTSVVHYDPLILKSNLPGPAQNMAFLKLYIPEIESVFRYKPSNVDEQLVVGGNTLTREIQKDLESIVSFRESVIAERES